MVVILPKNYFISMSLVSVKTWLAVDCVRDEDKEKRKSHISEKSKSYLKILKNFEYISQRVSLDSSKKIERNTE
jgi:hypothetical protein